MPMGDWHNSQLSSEGVIPHSAFGLMRDHTFACLVENCADLPWAWVLAIMLSMCGQMGSLIPQNVSIVKSWIQLEETYPLLFGFLREKSRSSHPIRVICSTTFSLITMQTCQLPFRHRRMVNIFACMHYTRTNSHILAHRAPVFARNYSCILSLHFFVSPNETKKIGHDVANVLD